MTSVVNQVCLVISGPWLDVFNDCTILCKDLRKVVVSEMLAPHLAKPEWLFRRMKRAACGTPWLWANDFMIQQAEILILLSSGKIIVGNIPRAETLSPNAWHQQPHMLKSLRSHVTACDRLLKSPSKEISLNHNPFLKVICFVNTAQKSFKNVHFEVIDSFKTCFCSFKTFVAVNNSRANKPKMVNAG